MHQKVARTAHDTYCTVKVMQISNFSESGFMVLRGACSLQKTHDATLVSATGPEIPFRRGYLSAYASCATQTMSPILHIVLSLKTWFILKRVVCSLWCPFGTCGATAPMTETPHQSAIAHMGTNYKNAPQVKITPSGCLPC
jgi:hypothetical protein